jgi:Tol biopolymer transport system component
LVSEPRDGPVTFGPAKRSPDGKHLAIVKGDSSAKSSVLLLIKLPSGERHELSMGAIIPSGNIAAASWTPDGRAVLVRKPLSSDRLSELWRVPVDGSEAVKLDWISHGQTSFSVHPDGRQLAFAAAEQKRPDEIWVLENFLPPPLAANK